MKFKQNKAKAMDPYRTTNYKKMSKKGREFIDR